MKIKKEISTSSNSIAHTEILTGTIFLFYKTQFNINNTYNRPASAKLKNIIGNIGIQLQKYRKI